MKKNFKFLSMAVLASLMVGGANTACTSDEANDLTAEAATVELVKAPDFMAWSGDVVYGDTRTTRAWWDNMSDLQRQVIYTEGLFHNEVEANLAINIEKEKGDWISSHLSVHVDTATNFTVTLPVAAEYYCAADDMDIVQSHKSRLDKELNIEGKEQTMTCTIAGAEVTLKVVFGEDKITISSNGITQEVINACRELNGDGITFEVWNYYNDEKAPNAPLISREGLRTELDKSTISFTTVVPDFYINAFGSVKTYDENGKEILQPGVKDPWACTVAPSNEEELFGTKVTNCPHGNGSTYNTIYVKKGVVLKDDPKYPNNQEENSEESEETPQE